LGTELRSRRARLRGRELADRQAVGLFVRREHAERFLDDVRKDDPKLAELLRLEPVELDA
jgi:hypothetical protein